MKALIFLCDLYHLLLFYTINVLYCTSFNINSKAFIELHMNKNNKILSFFEFVKLKQVESELR